ncbi:YerC/YecD family TrpR-related protein [Allosphingosinicella indica]|uniref:Trp operon repressor family n=1 Tax=Allosphingosinicella indica TaxID=941907 RepID=A0A1X7FYC2_9SPHN|nr:YerC/YecD family TrpR-related protein [Allosphingosinicella indica]SMF61079.1 Trp operon repressor family [Allosphingosinicella indica]
MSSVKSSQDLTDDLCDALLTPADREAMLRLLRDLCTPAEVHSLAERWHVARLLTTGMSYREIHEATGVSTTTVVRVARFLNQEPHQGYRDAIAALEARDADR